MNLVYPVICAKKVAWIDPDTGDISNKRKSPKKMGVYDVLFECVRIIKHITNPNLTVSAVLLEADEYRFLNGWSRDRKRGSERYEMIPTDISGIVQFKTDEDYAAFLPDVCRELFTASEFAKAAGMQKNKVYGVLKVFEARGLICRAGKRGRSNLYSRVNEV